MTSSTDGIGRRSASPMGVLLRLRVPRVVPLLRGPREA
jgi:hypothetical protein